IRPANEKQVGEDGDAGAPFVDGRRQGHSSDRSGAEFGVIGRTRGGVGECGTDVEYRVVYEGLVGRGTGRWSRHKASHCATAYISVINAEYLRRPGHF